MTPAPPHTPHHRTVLRRALLATLAAFAALLLASAPALALSQRGHVFTPSSFPTAGEGALSKPGAIAVSQQTGDVYVLDRRDDRVVQYGATGEFISAWGWDVSKDGKEGKEATFEVCTSECKEGERGRGDYQLNNFTIAIAVDNCTNSAGESCTQAEDPSVGDVYLVKEYADREEAKELKGEEKEKAKEVERKEKEGIRYTEDEREALEHESSIYAAIDKLSPSGARLEEFAFNEEACDFEGKYKKTGNEANGGPLACELRLEAEEVHGLTVGPSGTPYLYYKDELLPLSDTALSQPGTEPRPLGFEGLAGYGVAVDADGDVYAGHEGLFGASELPPNVFAKLDVTKGAEADLSEALDFEPSTAVAVNPLDVPANDVDEQDDVYVTNVAVEPGGASTTIAQFSPEGSLIQRFTTAGLTEAAGVAVDPATGAVYVSDAATGDIDLFTLESDRPPTVGSPSVKEVSSTSAQLNAVIDPDGSPTTYAFRYAPGPVPTAAEPCVSPCVETPAPEQALGEAYADQAVQAELGQGTSAPLKAAVTYHYRVIARNPHGAGESSESSFSTPAVSGEYTADARIWEMVSPAQKNGGAVESIDEETPHDGLIQAAADGNAITYMTTLPAGEAEGSRSYEGTQLLATRGSAGWSSKDIVTPNERGTSPGLHIGSEYKFFSEDLSLSLVAPFRTRELNEGAEGISRLAEPPLTPPATKEEEEKGQERTIYIRSDKPVAPTEATETGLYREAEHNGAEMEKAAEEKGEQVPNPGYLALLTDANVLPGAEFGGDSAATFIGANPDLTTSVFLLSGGIAGAKEGMYEWTQGTLKPVTVPPCKTEPCPPAEPVTDAQIGNQNANLRHAISDDGSRIFWSDEGHLYMRATKTPAGDSLGEETIRLDRALPEEPGEETNAGGAEFQTADAEGSRVFFTDSKPLTTRSGAEGTRDLYVCEIVQNSGHKLECDLTDLTPKHETPAHERESADVRGVVLGASEEGAYVYFVADGVLSEAANAQGEHAQPGSCARTKLPGAACNLYVDHYDAETTGWSQPRYIATVAQADSPDWESSYAAVTTAELDYITSRVSPNGRYLAFSSERELTGYDNVDSQPQADGAHDEEVYEYAAPSAAEEQAHEPGRLVCASCNPSGARPRGILDPSAAAHEAGQEFPLVDRGGAWSASWLAGSIPGSTEVSHDPKFPPFTLHQSRYLSDSGRLYFDSPADLVPEATNGEEDVYEYEPTGVPSGKQQCATDGATYSEGVEGCIGLISSGTATGEAAFLDASESGGEGPHGEELEEGGADVFFVSGAKLVPQDTETTYSLYDAHECTAGSPCIVPEEEKAPEVCQSTESCRAYTPPPASPLGAPASAAAGAAGNLAPQHAVLPSKTSSKPKPKPLTRAQKLAKALKACRADHKHSATKRSACEKQARKHYAPPKKANKATRKGSR